MPRVAVLAGDGIGKEVIPAAVRVLAAVRPDIVFEEFPIGGSAIEQRLSAFPRRTREGCERSDAVLLGAVGDARFDAAPERPEHALLAIRRAFDVYANVRPVRTLPGVEPASPLRADVVRGTNFVIVRELSSGLYYGRPHGQFVVDGMRTAVDTLRYDEREVRRVVDFAFALARTRRGDLTSVDKANVLATSRLWRAVVNEVAASYPDVRVRHMLVDTAAMKIVGEPNAFDVIVTENTFGDVLSDEAAAVVGSIGMLPSASLGDRMNSVGGRFGLYEPIAGSAPDIAGTDRANPIGAMLSAAMLLQSSLRDEASTRRVVAAIESVVQSGFATADLRPARVESTSAFARRVEETLRVNAPVSHR